MQLFPSGAVAHRPKRWWPSQEGLVYARRLAEAPATRQVYFELRLLLDSAADGKPAYGRLRTPDVVVYSLWIELCRDLSIPLRLLLAVRDPTK